MGTTRANPLPANVSPLLDTVYEQYENGTLPAPTGRPGTVEIQGSNIGIEIHVSNPSDFAAMVATAENLGLQVMDQSTTYDIVDGFLPISELPELTQFPASASVAPLLYPGDELNDILSRSGTIPGVSFRCAGWNGTPDSCLMNERTAAVS